jgi:serine/threonine-protein kinase
MARILSSTNPNIKELIYIVDNFADYNSNYYKNTDVQKFINYKTIGNLYTANLKENDVPEKAKKAMEDALESMDEYTGEEQGKTQADFSYNYNKNLGEIYKQIGNSKVGDDGDISKAENDYEMAIKSYQDVIRLVKSEVGSVDISTDDNKTLKSYIQTYVIAVRSIAEIYGKMDEKDKAIETYSTAEEEMGSGNVEAKQIYVDHLDYLYTSFEKTNQDPMMWSKVQKEEIISVYDEGNKIEGIEKLQNWSKRSSELEKLKDSLSGSAKSDDSKSNDTEKTDESGTDNESSSDSGSDSTEEGE